MNSTTTSLTFSVPENGNVLVRFKLQDQVEMLFIQVSIMSHSSQKYSRSSRKSTILSFFASNKSGFSTVHNSWNQRCVSEAISNSSCYFYLQARYQINEKTLKVYTNYSSPTGSYIQIGPINTLPAQVNFKHILHYCGFNCMWK